MNVPVEMRLTEKSAAPGWARNGMGAGVDME
jgi:hypothetical protein